MNKYSEKKPIMGAAHDPKPVTDLSIPPCEDMFFIKVPCYDFVWSGGGSHRIDSIVSRIMANNPGRPIPFDKVLKISFALLKSLHKVFRFYS